MKYVTTRQMQAIDRRASADFGIPPILLMENAGRVVAEEVLTFRPRRVLVVCGGGNNGGDGLVAARHLTNRGVRCTIVYLQRPAAPDAALNFTILEKIRVPLAWWGRLSHARWASLLRQADVIVDAIFGTGLSRSIRPPYTTAIEAINRSEKPVVSIDLPSGLHADTGRPIGACIRATRTVTLALPKRAFKYTASRAYTGTIVVADISIPRAAVRSIGHSS
jgi:NAD(P)H-hydrate epimerase